MKIKVKIGHEKNTTAYGNGAQASAGKMNSPPPEEEVNMKLFSLVANIAGGVEAFPDSLEPKSSDVLEAAFRHALRQFKLALADESIEEEHRTSALMGYVGGYTNIYNLLSALSGGEQSSIAWNAQKKKAKDGEPSENLTGGDFGILLPNGSDTYKLAFFQAKKENIYHNKFVRLDFTHRSDDGYEKDAESTGAVAESGLAVSAKEQATLAADAIHVANAQPLVGDGLGEDDQNSKKSETAIIEDHGFMAWSQGAKAVGEAKFYQTYKLALTAQSGDERSRTQQNWVHYILWPSNESLKVGKDIPSLPSDEAPFTVTLDALRKYLGQALSASDLALSGISKTILPRLVLEAQRKDFMSKEFVECRPFIDLLLDGIRKKRPLGWLVLKSDAAATLVGEISVAGLEWVVLDDEKGGGIVNKLRTQGMAVSKQYSELADVSLALKAKFPKGVPAPKNTPKTTPGNN